MTTCMNTAEKWRAYRPHKGDPIFDASGPSSASCRTSRAQSAISKAATV